MGQKRRLAEAIGSRPKKSKKAVSETKKKTFFLNPFERSVQPSKHDVLGRERRGQLKAPGRAREDSHKKREENLLVEYRQQAKTNEFIDRRFGERDKGLSKEDKLLMRFQREQQSKLKKSHMFSLEDAEDDILTHKGQAVDEIENFRDFGGGDSDDEGLDEETVGRLNFGGFEKPTREGVSGEEGVRKSKKEIMDEIIAKSKEAKLEKKKQKAEREGELEDLDKDFAALRGMIVAHDREKQARTTKTADDDDDFYQLVRKMTYEKRVSATDRKKTEEEVAKDEARRLSRLERERLQRMVGDDEDIGAGSEAEDEDEAQEELQGESITVFPVDTIGEEEQEQEDEDEEADASQQHARTSYETPFHAFCDLYDGTLRCEVPCGEESEDTAPFAFKEPPVDLFALDELMSGLSSEARESVFQRMLACFDYRVHPKNKERLKRLLCLVLLRSAHLGNNHYADPREIEILYRVAFKIVQQIPTESCAVSREIIRLAQVEYRRRLKLDDVEVSCWPALGFVYLLRILAALFPLTDHRHPVTTPLFLFIATLFMQTPVLSPMELGRALAMARLGYTMASTGEKFFPEPIIFVVSALSLPLSDSLSPKRMIGLSTFKSDMFEGFKPKPKAGPLGFKEIASQPKKKAFFLTSCVLSALETCVHFVSLHKSNDGAVELFEPLRRVLKGWKATSVLFDSLPSKARQLMEELSSTLEGAFRSSSSRMPLTLYKERATAIKSYNPQFETGYMPGVDYDVDVERKENKRLKKEYEREKKGAVRELKKDNAFLAAVRAKDEAKKREEREKNYKRIYTFLSQQQGDLNAPTRFKKGPKEGGNDKVKKKRGKK